MTKAELCNLLVRNAKKFRFSALEQLTRDGHMNDYDGEQIKQETIDALLVSFINFVAGWQGLDLALYTRHLDEP